MHIGVYSSQPGIILCRRSRNTSNSSKRSHLSCSVGWLRVSLKVGELQRFPSLPKESNSQLRFPKEHPNCSKFLVPKEHQLGSICGRLGLRPYCEYWEVMCCKCKLPRDTTKEKSAKCRTHAVRRRNKHVYGHTHPPQPQWADEFLCVATPSTQYPQTLWYSQQRAQVPSYTPPSPAGPQLYENLLETCGNFTVISFVTTANVTSQSTSTWVIIPLNLDRITHFRSKVYNITHCLTEKDY